MSEVGKRKVLEKYKLYLIIPSLIVIVWFVSALFHPNVNFYDVSRTSDFSWMYYSGKQLLIDPSKLYSPSIGSLYNTYYLPAFIVFTLLFFSPFPLLFASYLFAIINIILGIFLVLELNKIYQILGLEKIWKRFILLIISVSSWMLYAQFYGPQSKMIVAFIFALSIRKQFQTKILSTKKGYFYYFTMIFALSITPYFIFLFLILFIDDVGVSNLLKKVTLKKIAILIGFFSAQNFLYFIYPNLIYDGLMERGLIYGVNRGINTFWFADSVFQFSNVLLSYFLLFGFFICSIVIILMKLRLEIKLALFGLTYIWFGAFGWSEEFIPMSYILFLFIPYLKKANTLKDLVLNQKLASLCLILIFIINLMPINVEMFYKYIPFLINEPFLTLIIFRYVFLLSFLTLLIIILFRERIFSRFLLKS